MLVTGHEVRLVQDREGVVQLIKVKIDEHVRDVLRRTRDDGRVRKIRHLRPALAMHEDWQLEIRAGNGRAGRGLV